MTRESYQEQSHPSNCFHNNNANDVNVEAEGIDYVKKSKCTCDDQRMIIPTLFNVPDHEASIVALAEHLEYMRISSREESPPSDCGRTPRTSSDRKKGVSTLWEPIALRKFLSRSQPSSSSPTIDAPRSSSSEGDSMIRRICGNKRDFTKKMRHQYNPLRRPGPGCIPKCSCNSCWAENLKAISDDAVRPTFPFSCTASRTADKCERARVSGRIRFCERQTALTFDVWSGKVFDCQVETTDLSSVQKIVGGMMTWGPWRKASYMDQEDSSDEEDCDSDDDQEYDSEDSQEYDSDNSQECSSDDDQEHDHDQEHALSEPGGRQKCQRPEDEEGRCIEGKE